MAEERYVEIGDSIQLELGRGHVKARGIIWVGIRDLKRGILSNQVAMSINDAKDLNSHLTKLFKG